MTNYFKIKKATSDWSKSENVVDIYYVFEDKNELFAELIHFVPTVLLGGFGDLQVKNDQTYMKFL